MTPGAPGRGLTEAISPAELLRELLHETVAMGASDLHLTAGIAPAVRHLGELRPLSGVPELTPEDTEALAKSLLTHEQWSHFVVENDMDLVHSVPGLSRFRVNLYRQRGSIGAAFRVITTVKAFDDLGLPPVVGRFAKLKRGLVLVTGPTGSGKSTTLAGILDLANQTRTGHIVTIEDPIEYVHQHGSCVVTQREVGSDTAGFAKALRHALRQDPDIILVGELRDLETLAVAVSAAETGHLVLATLHTRSAAQAVERMIDMYPPDQQHQIRAQLADCLEGVVAQTLAPSATGDARLAVCEVLVATPAIRNLIREAKVFQIRSSMQAGSAYGMLTFDQHLAELYASGEITAATARDLAHDPEELSRLARFTG